MGELRILHGEAVPTDQDLLLFGDLQEIRYRNDGSIVVGLFLREEDRRMLIGIHTKTDGIPYTFEVDRKEANQAFEEPWKYADDTARILLERASDSSTYNYEAEAAA